MPCEEHGPVDIPLSDVLDATGRLRINPEIEKLDYFSVSLKEGELTLRARGYVGYIPLNDRVVVYIRPRVPIRNLSYITTVSGLPLTTLTSLRRYATGEEWNDSLIDLYAAAFIADLERLVASGMLHEYQRQEEISSFPRGRVLAHRTVQNLLPRNIHHAAHVTWSARSANNACNRCLKYALWILARFYISHPPSDKHGKRFQRRINAIYPAFDSVDLDDSRRFLDDPVVRGSRPLPPLWSYYRDALNVALAIIEKRGILLDTMDGDLRLASLVLNMSTIFERYVRQVLTLQAQENGWPVEVLDGNKDSGAKLLFDNPPSPRATPDIVLRQPDGRTPLVCEVKNIPVNGQFSDRDAINQAVTYAVSYAARYALLIHPCASTRQEPGIYELGSMGDITTFSIASI